MNATAFAVPRQRRLGRRILHRRRLYDSSIRDPLTHVFNRRYRGERLIAEVAGALLTNADAAF
jgi:GGDEF domain-containing protein